MTNTTALYHAIKPGMDSHNIDLHDLQPILHWPDEPFPFTHVPTVVFYAPRPGPVCEDGTKPTPYIAIGYKALRAEREQLFNVNCSGSDYICGRNFKLLLDPRETTARLLGEEAEKHDLDRAVARAKKFGYITNDLDMLEDFVTGLFEHGITQLETEHRDFDVTNTSHIKTSVALPFRWGGGDAQSYTNIIEKGMIRAGFGDEHFVPDIYLANESEAAAERALCALSHDLIEMSTSGQRL
jgi:hypothetical protein